MAEFPLAAATGKLVRFSGYIRSEGITTGSASLFWRVNGKAGTALVKIMPETGVTGTTEWRRYEIELPVAADAASIDFGAMLTGDGAAWFDGLQVELDSKPYRNADLLDLDFETWPPTGFHTQGYRYRVDPDRRIFHDGKQSLHMERLPDPPPGDPKVAAAAWQRVVDYLVSEREMFLARGASARDTDWAIQNSRLVLQDMRVRSGTVTRDQSMAENVKWIAESNPGAKLVLWSHNAHAAMAPSRGYQPMGAVLRRMFGSEMVVFGFAFNEGAFRALDPGKGLHDFTVPPAPAGSLDATLADSRNPLFVVGLRRAPGWLRAPHPTRSIGTAYDGSPYGSMYGVKATASFDALIFVEKTTAARSNPQP
jgi:hypothetical protein